jgi:chromosome segregation ATPase
MELPTPDEIKRVTDPTNLQDACLSLIRVCEKERNSKREYRQAAGALQQEVDRLKLELQCEKERSEALVSCVTANGSTVKDILPADGDLQRLSEQNALLQSQLDAMKREFSNLHPESGESAIDPSDLGELLELRSLIQMKDQTITQLNAEQQQILSILESNKSKAKERIENLKQTISEMRETHSSEIESLTLNLKSKTDELEALTAVKKKMTTTHKEKVAKLRATNATMRSKIDQSKVESDAQEHRIEELELKVRDDETQTLAMLQKISELQRQLSEIDDSRSLTSTLSSTIQKLKLEVFELQQRDQSNTDFQALLTEREAMIAQLKGQLQMFMKQDVDHSKKITELQGEICEAHRKIAELSASFSTTVRDGSAKIEREKVILEGKLRNSQASEELIRKNQKLTEMIENSNRLYAQLRDQHNALKRTVGKGADSDLRTELTMVFEVKPVAARKRAQKAKSDEVELAQNAYLRRVLLQFFAGENRNRAGLIPPILRLVGCDGEQVAAALRQWERSSHLFAGFFGM